MEALMDIKCSTDWGETLSVWDAVRFAEADTHEALIALKRGLEHGGSRFDFIAKASLAISRLTAARDAVMADGNYSVPASIDGYGVSFEVGPDGARNVRPADGIALLLAVDAGLSMDEARDLALDSAKNKWTQDKLKRIIAVRAAGKTRTAGAARTEHHEPAAPTATGNGHATPKSEHAAGKTTASAAPQRRSAHPRRDELMRKLCDKEGTGKAYRAALRERLSKLSETSARVFDECSGVGVGAVGKHASSHADQLAQLDVLLYLQGLGWDPYAGKAYRSGKDFKRLERKLLAGRKPNRLYRALVRVLVQDERQYRDFMASGTARAALGPAAEWRPSKLMYGCGGFLSDAFIRAAAYSYPEEDDFGNDFNEYTNTAMELLVYGAASPYVTRVVPVLDGPDKYGPTGDPRNHERGYRPVRATCREAHGYAVGTAMRDGDELLRPAAVAGYVLGTTDYLWNGNKEKEDAARKRETEWLTACVDSKAKWVLMPELDV